MRPAAGKVGGLALSSLLLAGCGLLVSLDGLSGGAPEAADAAGSEWTTTGDARVDAPHEDGSAPLDSAGAVDGAPGDSAHVGLDSSSGGDAPHPGDSAATTDSPAEAAIDAGSVYASAVIADGPLAYWRLGETTGTVAHDATGNGNDAQIVGGVTLAAGGALIGDTDTAATLDGVSGHLDVGNRFPFTGNAPHTLEIWARPQNIDTSYQRLFSREPATTPREGYLVFVRAPNAADSSTFSVERWSAGATNQCPESTPITLVWHHFVATYDGSTSRIYLDGALAASQPAPLSLDGAAASLWIGASAFDTAAYFSGAIDEVAVYGTELAAARIAAHFHASGR